MKRKYLPLSIPAIRLMRYMRIITRHGIWRNRDSALLFRLKISEGGQLNSIKNNRIHIVLNTIGDNTTFFYDLAEATRVKIEIFNMQGDLIKTVVNQYKPAGKYSESGKMVVIH